jgi:carboxypeptidase D
LETYPQIINFDTDVYNYFKTQYVVSPFIVSTWTIFDNALVREHLCKYDLNLTYPQRGHFPSLIDPRQTSNLYSLSELKAKSVKSSWHSAIAQKFAKHNRNSNPRARNINKREEKRQQWKRDLIGRPNGTLDPYYGCFLWEEMTDYAVNFSFPWSASFRCPVTHAIDTDTTSSFQANGGFDVCIDTAAFLNSLYLTRCLWQPYFIPDALNPEVTPDPSVFMNGWLHP